MGAERERPGRPGRPGCATDTGSVVSMLGPSSARATVGRARSAMEVMTGWPGPAPRVGELCKRAPAGRGPAIPELDEDLLLTGDAEGLRGGDQRELDGREVRKVP